VRRHAKASSAGSTHGIGSSRGLFGRAFATRGASSDTGGSGAPSSGAPSHRSRGIAGLLGLALIASGALFGGAAQPAAAATCANEALRLQSNVNPLTTLPYSAGLPECRAYEMVSPVEKQAHDVREAWFMSDDGENVAFNIFGQLPDGEGFNSFNPSGNSFLTKRSDAGWATRGSTAPSTLIQRTAGVPYLLDYSPDFSRYASCGHFTISAQGSTDNAVCVVHTPNGWVSSPVYRTMNGTATGAATVGYLGGSEDLSHVVFNSSTPMKLLSADTYAGNGSSMYEIAGLGTDSPVLRVVNVDNNGNQIAAASKAVGLGFTTGSSSGGDTYQAVSDDGNTIYFMATPIGGTTQTVYARRNGTTTVAVSNPSPPECTICSPTSGNAIFQGASADGSKVYFLTSQQLVNADTDTTRDLYQYDFSSGGAHHLIQVSGGGPGDLTPGAGANVSGVVRTSEDGSRAYFVATGALTTLANGNGQTAVAGSPNLYMFQRDNEHPEGSTKFVATLDSTDSELWPADDGFRQARTTPDGSFLVFVSRAALTPDDLDSANDVYRYDAGTGQLVRISIGEPSFPASNNGNTAGKDGAVGPIYAYLLAGAQASVNQRNNPISDDGSYVIFSSPEKLQENDVDGVPDVYLWHNGVVSLISDGRDASSSYGNVGKEISISADGRDITFNTRTQLSPSDTDLLQDVYDARVGGGIAYTPPAPLCDSVEACHGSAAAAPSGPTAGTAGFTGPANPAPGKPAKQKPKKHKKKHHKTQHPKKHSTGKRR
jgi:hypothetical protein